MSSEYLNAFITFAVGLVALIVYWLSKRHEKRNAATVIVMDIRHAEQVVLSIVERGVVDRSLKPILYENNWAKYKHLFASDFSYDDFASLNRFFDSCVQIAAAKERMNDFFYASVNAKAALLQEKILSIEDPESPEGKERRLKLIARFNAESYAFDPDEPRDVVRHNLNLIGRPSNSMAFAKLKKIAGVDA